MNLYWPACISYKRQLDAKASENTIAEVAMKAAEAPAAEQVSASTLPELPATAFSTTYERTLCANEFRLLCLSAVKNSSGLIHVTLETCQDDDYPEYETVSYAWGGENGDNTRRNPIYIGQYWDVLLQTRNCWSLLQYLQPRSGIRLVWVDAICIDQSSTLEKDTQVAKMANIYQRCLRVVVYLGDSVARSTRSSSPHHSVYPRRRGFHELFDRKSASKINLQELFRLRYFTRVWVIQELLLAPCAVIPIDNVEYTTGGLTATRLATSYAHWSFDTTAAPWMQHICSGKVFQAKDLVEALRQTWTCKATDVRDRIFGILGLVQDDIISHELKPDYSISPLHTFIGIFAYLLLNLKVAAVLKSASGHAAPATFPSWLPDWNLHNNLQNMFQWPRASQWGEPTTDQIVETRHTDKTETNVDPSWDFNLSIDPTSSILSMSLIHLFKIMSRPMELERHNGQTITRVLKILSENCCLDLETPDIPLDVIIEPGKTDLFLLLDRCNSRIFVLFMRETCAKGVYRLIQCCHCYKFLPFVNMYGALYRTLDLRSRDEWYKCACDLYETVHSRLRKVVVNLGDINRSLYHHFYNDPAKRDYLTSSGINLAEVFPNPRWTVKHVLPVFQGLINENTGNQPDFFECYATFLSKRFPDYEPVSWEWRESWTQLKQWACALDKYRRWGTRMDKGESVLEPPKRMSSEPTILVRTRLDDLKKHLRQTTLYKTLCQLSPCTRLTSEDEVTMLTRGPKFEDHFLACWDWPQLFIDGFQVDGRMRKVNVL